MELHDEVDQNNVVECTGHGVAAYEADGGYGAPHVKAPVDDTVPYALARPCGSVQVVPGMDPPVQAGLPMEKRVAAEEEDTVNQDRTGHLETQPERRRGARRQVPTGKHGIEHDEGG